MTPEFLAAVIDTLLPGDGILPSGTQVPPAHSAYARDHRAVFDAISGQAGRCELFVRADEGTRAAILKSVESAMTDAFSALLVSVLSDYYQAVPVLSALKWRSDPPQPPGHAVPKLDDPTAERLDRVRRRSPFWRV